MGLHGSGLSASLRLDLSGPWGQFLYVRGGAETEDVAVVDLLDLAVLGVADECVEDTHVEVDLCGL